MPRNGSGTFNLVANSWNPAVNGTTATAADYQTLINDVAAALTQSVSVDGQAPMTGNLPMGNNKITGLASGVAGNDATNVSQIPLLLFPAWTASSPAVTASSGTFTTVSGSLRYRTNNKTTVFNLIVTITTNGTAAGGITVTMPFSALTESVFGGRETQSTGLACTGTMNASSNILTIFRYDNLYAGGSSYRIVINGVVENT